MLGVIQRSGGSCFLHKAPHSLSIGSEIKGKDFQRNCSVKLRILREINLAHSAHAEL